MRFCCCVREIEIEREGCDQAMSIFIFSLSMYILVEGEVNFKQRKLRRITADSSTLKNTRAPSLPHSLPPSTEAKQDDTEATPTVPAAPASLPAEISDIPLPSEAAPALPASPAPSVPSAGSDSSFSPALPSSAPPADAPAAAAATQEDKKEEEEEDFFDFERIPTRTRAQNNTMYVSVNSLGR